MFTTAKKLFICAAFALLSTNLYAASYYGGSLKNHGHSSAPGDGGPLTNPSFLGNITTTGTINANDLNLTGNFNTTILNASSMSITGGTTSGIDVSTGGMTARLSAGSLTFFNTSGVGGLISIGGANDVSSHWTVGVADLFLGITGSASSNRRAELWGCNTNCTSWPALYNSYASTPSVTIDVGSNAASAGKINLKGAVDGSEAPPYYWSEYISSQVANPTNFPSSGSVGDLAVIPISSGDWKVTAKLHASANGATVAQFTVGLSSVPGNSAAPITKGINRFDSSGPTATNSQSIFFTFRVLTTASTNYYLKYSSNYSVATPQAVGEISAERRR